VRMPDTSNVQPLMREKDGRIEPVVVGEDTFEIPTFLRHQMD
jgi:hypothetical protein